MVFGAEVDFVKLFIEKFMEAVVHLGEGIDLAFVIEELSNGENNLWRKARQRCRHLDRTLGGEQVWS
jgi:hypothetical protein